MPKTTKPLLKTTILTLTLKTLVIKSIHSPDCQAQLIIMHVQTRDTASQQKIRLAQTPIVPHLPTTAINQTVTVEEEDVAKAIFL